MLQMALGHTLQTAQEHHRAGRIVQAELLYREILRQDSKQPDALNLLGLLAHQTGHSQAGEELLRQARALRPGDPAILDNLAVCLFGMARYGEAIEVLREITRVAPDYGNAYYNLGTALQTSGQLDEAAAVYQEARERMPGDPMIPNNLAIVLALQGDVAGAIGLFRQVLAAHPGDAVIHSNLIYHLHLDAAQDGGGILEECREWNRRHARPVAGGAVSYSNVRDPERTLRIGYVSPDFRDHVVGRNLLPLVRHTGGGEGAGYEMHCFYNGTQVDEVTEEYRRRAAGFHGIAGLSDAAAAALIRSQGIDVLVDLALHTAGNRLLVLARRPAPVQATFAGYPGTTGVEGIGYRLSDAYLDPPGAGDGMYSEETVRVATTMCLAAPAEAPEVGPLPMLAHGGRGGVTFGCLNGFNRVTPQMLTVFAGVLRKVEGSRLMLRVPAGSAQAGVRELMEREGVDAGRIVFQATRPRGEYLATYQQIDIGLDTLPYNGFATSLEAMYMGVPVVTLAGGEGATGVSRAGASLLMNLGLGELIGRTEGEFVAIAAGLAGDTGRLAELRRGLRGRLAASALMDGAGYARAVNGAWRGMWRRWCTE